MKNERDDWDYWLGLNKQDEQDDWNKLDEQYKWDDLNFDEGGARKRFDTLKRGDNGIWKIISTSGKILNKMSQSCANKESLKKGKN